MMFHVIAVAYPAEQQVEKVMAQVQHMHASGIADLEAVVFLTLDTADMLHLYWQGDRFATNAWDVVIDALVLALTAGLPPELQACALDDSFIRRLSAILGCMHSAILIGMRQMVCNKILPELQGLGGIVLQTTMLNLAEDEEHQRMTRAALLV